MVSTQAHCALLIAVLTACPFVQYSLQKPPGVGGQKPASPASQKAAAGGATVAVRQADPLQQQVEELKKRCATLEEVSGSTHTHTHTHTHTTHDLMQ